VRQLRFANRLHGRGTGPGVSANRHSRDPLTVYLLLSRALPGCRVPVGRTRFQNVASEQDCEPQKAVKDEIAAQKNDAPVGSAMSRMNARRIEDSCDQETWESNSVCDAIPQRAVGQPSLGASGRCHGQSTKQERYGHSFHGCFERVVPSQGHRQNPTRAPVRLENYRR
jgi:hypothetical protein